MNEVEICHWCIISSLLFVGIVLRSCVMNEYVSPSLNACRQPAAYGKAAWKKIFEIIKFYFVVVKSPTKECHKKCKQKSGHHLAVIGNFLKFPKFENHRNSYLQHIFSSHFNCRQAISNLKTGKCSGKECKKYLIANCWVRTLLSRFSRPQTQNLPLKNFH